VLGNDKNLSFLQQRTQSYVANRAEDMSTGSIHPLPFAVYLAVTFGVIIVKFNQSFIAIFNPVEPLPTFVTDKIDLRWCASRLGSSKADRLPIVSFLWD
jgi:hypothetical protein